MEPMGLADLITFVVILVGASIGLGWVFSR